MSIHKLEQEFASFEEHQKEAYVLLVYQHHTLTKKRLNIVFGTTTSRGEGFTIKLDCETFTSRCGCTSFPH